MITIDNISKIFENNSNGVWVYLEPADYTMRCYSAEDIINGFNEEYCSALIGIEETTKDTYKPVFTEEVQKAWDKQQKDYIANKAAWCAKYGCD